MTLDYAKARETMVEQQVRPWDVLDPRVLDVLATLPREAFVPAAYRALAYTDVPLPLAHCETMMKPVVEGRTLQALDLGPGDDVLEIGAGSGFLTACLARLAREVVSIERHADLADGARAQLTALSISNATVITADAMAYQTDRRRGSRDPGAFSELAATRRAHVHRPRPFAGYGSGTGPRRRRQQRCQRVAHPIVV